MTGFSISIRYFGNEISRVEADYRADFYKVIKAKNRRNFGLIRIPPV